MVALALLWRRNMKKPFPLCALVATLAMFGAFVVGLSAVPLAPSPIAPASGDSVQTPFAISWSAVSDATGIIGYNWQVSPSSSFSPVIVADSTDGVTTAAAVSGLANGTYFWRVRAVNGAFEQGAWSPARSVTVSGIGAGAPPTPTLAPPKAYSTFHPYEVMTFTWSAVAGASNYVLEAATDPNFPVSSRVHLGNIPNTTYSFSIGNPEGSYFARVFAVNANAISSAPSNVVTFSVFYNNPLPAPPAPLAPANGATLTLPITIAWTDVPNPQPSGYDLQIARDSRFSVIEDLASQLNNPTRTVLSLTPGQKFWRVHSVQGDASPTTAAVTAWSATGSFTVSSAPPTPVSVSFTRNPLTSGDTTWVQLQLTSAPPVATSISLTSSNPAAAPVPAAVTMPANIAWTQFQTTAGQVASTTPATITATLNGASASGTLTIGETALKSLTISPSTLPGGATATAIVMLTGQAPPGGAAITLSSDSAAATPPASVFINPGSFSTSFSLATTAVAATTTATLTAEWNGTTTQGNVTLTASPDSPPPPPAPSLASISVNPASVTGGSSSQGTLTLTAAAPAGGVSVALSSSNAAAAVPATVTVTQGATTAAFSIVTSVVTASTPITVTAAAGGVTRTAALAVTPQPQPVQSAALTVAASGRSGERVTSNPAGISVATGSSGSASFTAGASITLSVTNGRAAIWSGACSSGGNKTRSCTFTLNAVATVNANVQ